MIISYPTDDDRTFLESNPVFQQLDAVKNGKYVRLEQADSAALGFPSALSIPLGTGPDSDGTRKRAGMIAHFRRAGRTYALRANAVLT
ncbi:MAG: hypothetical protein ACRDSF_29330 [Pseudonocardiaceae bacterium]